MATLTKDKRTGAFVIQWNENNGKRRKTITLSSRKFRQKTAELIKEPGGITDLPSGQRYPRSR